MMMKRVSALVGAAALALGLAASPGRAAAEVISFPQPEAVWLNFDLTGESPGPLFDSIELTIPRDAVTAMGCSVFADVMSSLADRAGAQFVNGCASSATRTYTYFNPEMLDGLFSIGFGLLGSVTVTDPFAVGIRNGQRTDLVLGALVPGQHLTGQVSEPATLALLGIALVAGVARRRSPQAGCAAPSCSG